jgi:hypothetical protein
LLIRVGSIVLQVAAAGTAQDVLRLHPDVRDEQDAQDIAFQSADEEMAWSCHPADVRRDVVAVERQIVAQKDFFPLGVRHPADRPGVRVVGEIGNGLVDQGGVPNDAFLAYCSNE